MHTYEEYRQILELWEVGFKKKRISILTGVNRTTVYECIVRYKSVEGLEALKEKHPDIPVVLKSLMAGPGLEQDSLFEAYAYLLGLYLGDGYINPLGRTYKLRIALDTHYPDIISSTTEAMQMVAPSNIVNIVKEPGNCVSVTCHSNHWPAIFPQHGPGKKHERPIILEDWQNRIVEMFPLEFFRGLFHSDGSRAHNVVNGKDYPRYEFSNFSADIRRLFCTTCDRLGVSWRTASGGHTIQIARRPDVEFLDRHIGPKS